MYALIFHSTFFLVTAQLNLTLLADSKYQFFKFNLFDSFVIERISYSSKLQYLIKREEKEGANLTGP